MGNLQRAGELVQSFKQVVVDQSSLHRKLEPTGRLELPLGNVLSNYPSPHKKQILATYQLVLTDQSVPVSHDQVQAELLHSGLVIEKDGHLHSASEIYRHIFTPFL